MDMQALTQRLADNPNRDGAGTALVTEIADLLDGLTQDPIAIKDLASRLRQHAPGIGAAICNKPEVKQQQLKNEPEPTPVPPAPPAATTPKPAEPEVEHPHPTQHHTTTGNRPQRGR